MPGISVVIAAYNEETTLRDVCERCLRVLSEISHDYEVIVLDDASTDRTPEIVSNLIREHPGIVRAITHQANLGIAATFEELFRAASREYVFDVPADGEYPPEVLRDMRHMLDEYDIIVCNRLFKRYTLYRRVVSSCYRLLPRLLFGVELYDPGSTKLRRRAMIADVRVTSIGVFVEAERMIRAVKRGYRLGKVDIEPEQRVAGDPRGARLSYMLVAVYDLACLWIRLYLLRQPP